VSNEPGSQQGAPEAVMSQAEAPSEPAMSQGANKEQGSQQGGQRASNEPGSQKDARRQNELDRQ